MSAVRTLATVALGAMALAGCTSSPTEPVRQAAPATAEVQVPVVEPAEIAAMPDLTEDVVFQAVLDRHRAAIEAAEAAEAEAVEAAETDNHCDDPDWWMLQQSGDPGTYELACGEYPYWLEQEFDPGEGEYEPTPEELEGYGVYDEYGYEQCGELCGEAPTSGDEQHRFGCEQGYITEDC